MLYSHLVCCFWFFISTSDATGVSQPTDPPADDAFQYPLRTWVTEFNLQYASVASQYIASLYFTFMTLFTVGYGDIHATNTGERFYCIILEFSAAILFSAVIARVRAVVDSQNLNAKVHPLPWPLSERPVLPSLALQCPGARAVERHSWGAVL